MESVLENNLNSIKIIYINYEPTQINMKKIYKIK